MGEPLISALLRLLWERMRARMLDGIHQHRYADLIAAHFNVPH